MEISINRALSELKLLNKKIADKTAGLHLAGHTNKDIDRSVVEQFIKQGAETFQQVKDLIKRRNAIKAAIVASNAQTQVVVGRLSMTVAEAIERKSAIEMEKALHKKMREEFYSHKNHVEQQNDALKDKADKQAEAALGQETARAKGEEYTILVDAYMQRNKLEFICVDGLEKEIETMQDAIDEFESEVDFVLTESNTKTMIDV